MSPRQNNRIRKSSSSSSSGQADPDKHKHKHRMAGMRYRYIALEVHKKDQINDGKETPATKLACPSGRKSLHISWQYAEVYDTSRKTHGSETTGTTRDLPLASAAAADLENHNVRNFSVSKWYHNGVLSNPHNKLPQPGLQKALKRGHSLAQNSWVSAADGDFGL